MIEGEKDGLRILCVYVPNGKEVGSESYQYKLKWMKDLHDYLQAIKKGDPILVLGDFNIAPEDIDTHDPDNLRESLLYSSPEREALQQIFSLGFVDIFRTLNNQAKDFTWWDYRQLCFQKNKGFRIDLILGTEAIASRARRCWILRDERKGEKPSDHVPVMVEIAD